MGRADGVTEEELDALPAWAESPLFDERERAALAWADAVVAGSQPPDELYERVRAVFSEEQVIELTAAAVWEIAAAKFNRALDIEAQGVCRIARSAGS